MLPPYIDELNLRCMSCRYDLTPHIHNAAHHFDTVACPECGDVATVEAIVANASRPRGYFRRIVPGLTAPVVLIAIGITSIIPPSILQRIALFAIPLAWVAWLTWTCLHFSRPDRHSTLESRAFRIFDVLGYNLLGAFVAFAIAAILAIGLCAIAVYQW